MLASLGRRLAGPCSRAARRGKEMKTQSRAGAFRWISPAATPSNVGTCRARLQPARAFCSRAVAEAVTQEFDYVIVGAGSAGCVLANRLSEDGKHSVLLLEYGDNDRADPRDLFLHMPTALAIPMNMQKYNWGFEAEPEPNLGGRRLHCPRGKVLGGSSSINGMVFVRGHALDFDHWRDQHGAHGWGYEDCLPYFKKMETWAESPHEEDAPFRATGGPLAVRNGSSQNPLYAAFVEAGKQAGYGITRDYNGHRQEGFGKMAMTVTSDGARASTATCYLRPARSRANLSVATNALAHRILFDQGAPKPKAKGVVFSKSRELRVASARREVILCAGAIGSPQLLQLSGIGPAPVLESLGVDHVARLPGVGSNLQDHLELLLQYTCKEPVSLYDNMTMLGKLAIGVRWLLMRDGLGATNHMEATGFIRSDAGIEYPDIQYHFVPLAISYDGNTSLQQHGFQVHCGPNRSKSRGHLHALSADPAQHPKIVFNYLSHPDDMPEWRKVVRLTREIVGQAAMDKYRQDEVSPGGHLLSDAEIDAAVRAGVESAYHPCGTCRMGSGTDDMDVVDPDLRVLGVDGLRVVDASIMPRITNGNLNAPTIMIAEKAADKILGKPALAPLDVKPWIDPHWRTRQRSSSAP